MGGKDLGFKFRVWGLGWFRVQSVSRKGSIRTLYLGCCFKGTELFSKAQSWSKGSLRSFPHPSPIVCRSSDLMDHQGAKNRREITPNKRESNGQRVRTLK